MEGLGPRVVSQQLGDRSLLVDQKLRERTVAASLMDQAFLVQYFADNDPRSKVWPPRFADQFLSRKACRDMVRQHEKRHGFFYDVYVRARLDLELMETFPTHVVHGVYLRRQKLSMSSPLAVDRSEDPTQLYLQSSLERAQTNPEAREALDSNGDVITRPKFVHGVAAVPSGEDYGFSPDTGLMDKFFIGDATAFEADASVWLTLVNNMTGYASTIVRSRTPSPTRGYSGKGTWLMESLNRDHNIMWGIEVNRFPLHYVTLSVDGSAKYFSELQRAVAARPTLLHDRPELCGTWEERWKAESSGCSWETGKPLVAADGLALGIMPESTRKVDAGLCRLMRACDKAAATGKAPQPNAMHLPTCGSDGTVQMDGKWIHGTARCLFDDLVERLQTQEPSGSECPAAKLIQQISDGRVTRSDIELVVSSFDEDLSWLKPWANIRTVYHKGPLQATEALRKRGALHDAVAGDLLVEGGRCGARAPKSAIRLLPNVGRESHTYLYHITSRYETLAKRTVFVQDREPSCGFFFANGDLGNHLIRNTSLFDYLDPLNGDTFMPLTVRMDSNLSMSSMRSSFADVGEEGRVSRPVPVVPTGREPLDNWLPWETNEFQEWIYNTTRKTVLKSSGELPPRMVSFREFYQRVFEMQPPAVIHFAQGGQFAASASAIRRTPKHKYQYVLDMIEAGHEEFVYYCEAGWYAFMHGPTHPMHQLDESSTALKGPNMPFLSHLPEKKLLETFEDENIDDARQKRLLGTNTNPSWIGHIAIEHIDHTAPWVKAYFAHLQELEADESANASSEAKKQAKEDADPEVIRNRHLTLAVRIRALKRLRVQQTKTEDDSGTRQPGRARRAASDRAAMVAAVRATAKTRPKSRALSEHLLALVPPRW